MTVSIVKARGSYPDIFPYDPGESYPEYKGEVSGKPNHAYAAVRKSLEILGCDNERFNSAQWNPLGHLIFPGNRVFIKPNLVAHIHRGGSGQDESLYSVITHPSVVRAVLDYVMIALKDDGKIVIGDSPSVDADFDRITAALKLDLLAGLYNKGGVKCVLMDLRECRCAI